LAKIAFPTLGEVVKYLFKISGFAPLSRGSNSVFESETQKKSFLKALDRLSNETISLEQNFQKVLETFLQFVAHEAPDERFVAVIAHGIHDVYVQYRDLLVNEGTYLSKKESIAWLIKTRLISRLCLSQQKLFYMYNLSARNVKFPEQEFWYLPDLTEEGDIEWPLTKALKWVYEFTGTSITQFHYPGKSAVSDDARLNQNLENAFRWNQGKPCRSWSTLKQNLLDSFKALENYSEPKFHRHLDKSTKESVLFSLFIAHMSTEACRDIQTTYGQEFLLDCIRLFQQSSNDLKQDHSILKASVSKIRDRNKITEREALDELWYDLTQQFWQYYSYKARFFAKLLQSFLNEHAVDQGESPQITAEIIAKWKKEFGSSLVNITIAELENSAKFQPSAAFLEFYHDGSKLRSSRTSSLSEIQVFEQALKSANLNEELCWIVSWSYANYYYRRSEYKFAHEYFCQAFEQGKYRAGKEQYQLLNQYIESCAKQNEWLNFKKGVAWATFVGLEVRWVRDDHDSPKALKKAFDIFKTANYIV
jgi:hypothetical protein